MSNNAFYFDGKNECVYKEYVNTSSKDYINIKPIYEKSTAAFLLLPNYKWQLGGNRMLKASKIPLLNSRSIVLLNHSVKSHSHEDVRFQGESSFGFNGE